ncbi:MAG: DUF1992 domain-containing protein [Thermomicrobiales bacterium]|nr:DUF1992 domain-containing protein [Thermomicrobiales bacterium]
MSPIRKRDDFRAEQIDSWDDYVRDELLQDMQENDYLNLPDRGKPIKIWKTDLDPDKDLAFSRLKNAGIKPEWMELDHEIGELTTEIWEKLDIVEHQLRTRVAEACAPDKMVARESESLWQRFRNWFRQDYSHGQEPRPTLTTIMAEREWERKRFLELAAHLDKKISTYHDSLPAGAQHLQRLRWLPDRAGRVFDERITLTDWWEASDA